MTTLLAADEAARLHVGVNSIVRAGDRAYEFLKYAMPGYSWRSQVPPDKAGSAIMHEDGRIKTVCSVAPQDWVALTGPCPRCRGNGRLWRLDNDGTAEPCPDCRDGRRIEPLYTVCPNRHAFRGGWADCQRCDEHGRMLVGLGSIEVVPVVAGLGGVDDPFPRIGVVHDDGVHDGLYLMRAFVYPSPRFDLPDPLPVPGRDFVIVIDCVEVV